MKDSIIISLSFALMLCACERGNFDNTRIPSAPEQRDPFALEVSCSVQQMNAEGQTQEPGIPTKGIIGQTTITSLDANFIRLNEPEDTDDRSATYSPSEFTGWDDSGTRILDASILSSPDNYDGIYFRSVVFRPRQAYRYYITSDTDVSDTVAYITRMVGWYPKTEEIPATPDEDGELIYSEPQFNTTSSYTEVNGVPCVRFDHKLDGKTDVMVSDMREGRFDLKHKGFMNNSTGNDRDVQPYGHMYIDYMNPELGFEYCNYFTFNHYLTAIRLYMQVEKSDLSLIGWKRIDDVTFPDQPQSVTVELPVTQCRSDEAGMVDGTHATLPFEGVPATFGKAVEWADPTSMTINKDAMAENDPQYPQFAETASYPVEMEHTVDFDRVYLGYILARPSDPDETDPSKKMTDVEIHTDAGIVTFSIPHEYEVRDADGNKTGETVNILEAGHIYNIVIDLKTDGSLDVILENENDKHYRDLAPYNTNIQDFEYSNCYVVSQDKMKKDDGSWYDGFFFQASVAGCGKRGVYDTGFDLYPQDVYFEPHSAKILWQDKPYLITNVELIHGYVRFTLNDRCRDESNPLEGNAVIAVYDKDENIMWSWHIWVENDIQDITYNSLTYQNYETVSGGSDHYENRNPSATTLTDVRMMNMNLGATRASWSGAGDVLETYGLYYQWGRKDPLPGPSAYNYSRTDLSTATYYYMDEGERSRIYEHLTSVPEVETSVRRPLDVIGTSLAGGTYPYDWLYESVDGLWGYDPTDTKVKKKTIYDPCPYGYRVPDEELAALFDYFGRNSANGRYENNYGIVIPSNNGQPANYFPYAGWKGNDRGRTDRNHGWYEVGNLGDYQDARICKNANEYMNHRGRSILIRSSLFNNTDTDRGPIGSYAPLDVNPAYTRQLTVDFASRTSASSVRCVRYDTGVEQEPAQ